MNLSRSMYYYKTQKDDTAVMEKLKQLAEEYFDEGQDKYCTRIKNEGIPWNHKRIRRVYRLMNLHHRRPHKKRIPARVKEPLTVPVGPNETWSMDFMSDALSNGRRFRTLNILDDFNREALYIEPGFSIGAALVIKALDRLVLERGKPKAIRVDNGPEFIAHALQQWSSENNITLLYIQPGRPMQNAFIERFNRSYRKRVLNAYLFADLDQVRNLSQEFLQSYNHDRPHESLENMSPVEYRLKKQSA